MFLMYVKKFIALFPNQISERHTFSDKNYLIMEPKMNRGPTNSFSY